MFSEVIKYKLPISFGILLIFYSVGLVGILWSHHSEDFVKLSGLNLLISGVVLFVNHEKWNNKLVISLLVIVVLGYLIEVMGVQTGMIFGEYNYGDSLGVKMFGVPLIIGLNWVMLCYFSVFTLSKWIKSWWLLSSASALLLLGMDFIIEPVAIKLNFWSWKTEDIPVQNFVAWFIIAAVFNKLIVLTKEDSVNKIAPYLFLIQLIFFVVLRITL